MEMKIIIAAGVFFAGWLWCYLFGRQFLFNVMTAYPEIRKMQAAKKDLIADSSKSYTTISVIVCVFVIAVVAFLIFRFCPLYLKISFAVGAVLSLIMFAGKMSPDNKTTFETFCRTYYRFVLDDELRTAMYNCKLPQMKIRMHDMELPLDFIPHKFKD